MSDGDIIRMNEIPPYVFDELTRLDEAFPKSKFPAGSVNAYARNLAHIPPDTLMSAVSVCIQTCKYFPSIAEIIQASINPFRPGDPNAEMRKRTRSVASMCAGFDEMQIRYYLSVHRISQSEIDMPYLRHLIRVAEEERERLLNIQWPERSRRV